MSNVEAPRHRGKMCQGHMAMTEWCRHQLASVTANLYTAQDNSNDAKMK